MRGRVAWTGLGALLCAASVAAGAFGAHGLKARIDSRALELWETAAAYLMYAGLGLAVSGVLARLRKVSVGFAGTSLLAGALVFSGTVFALALDGPRWLGAVTPIGGLLMVLGWVLLAVLALRPDRPDA